MKSGITRVCVSLLCFIAAGLLVAHLNDARRIDVPAGFDARPYSTGIAGAREISVRTDGTVTLFGRTARDGYEIVPPMEGAPVTVMRVATELTVDARNAARGEGGPQFVSLNGNAALATPQAIAVDPRTLALARTLDDQAMLDVALAPDGTLYVADSRTGRVWRVSRESR